METIKEFIDIICHEHNRTSCSDENISNGFYLEDDEINISKKYQYRCSRCALLEISNGKIKINESNSKLIQEWMF